MAKTVKTQPLIRVINVASGAITQRLADSNELIVKICVILNPKAGSMTNRDAVLKQIRRLRPFSICVTRKKGAAKALATEAIRRGCDYLIAAGGDGTLNEVVNGVARHARHVRIGLIPLGTGNDFARCLNLPGSVDENIEILAAAKTTEIDLVRVKSDRVRYFVNVSAGGFSGEVNEKLTRQLKRSWGPLAYLRGAAAALPQLKAYHTSIAFGPGKPISLDLYNVVIANGRFVAGGLPVAPNANPRDGLLDVILIRQRPPSELALLGAKMVLGKHLSSRAIMIRRVSKISIKSRPGMWFNIDGELVGNEPAVFEVIPRALQFVVGKK